MGFIAGKYSITYAGSTAGQTGNDTVQLEHMVFKEIITGDNFAETPQDAVFRGMAQFIQYTMLEYDALAARPIFYPYGSAWLTMDTVIGTLDSANASQLVLTALAGTPAASSPATVTLPLAILAEGFPVQLLMAPMLRRIPVRQRIYPNASGVFGTLT